MWSAIDSCNGRLRSSQKRPEKGFRRIGRYLRCKCSAFARSSQLSVTSSCPSCNSFERVQVALKFQLLSDRCSTLKVSAWILPTFAQFQLLAPVTRVLALQARTLICKINFSVPTNRADCKCTRRWSVSHYRLATCCLTRAAFLVTLNRAVCSVRNILHSYLANTLCSLQRLDFNVWIANRKTARRMHCG